MQNATKNLSFQPSKNIGNPFPTKKEDRGIFPNSPHNSKKQDTNIPEIRTSLSESSKTNSTFIKYSLKNYGFFLKNLVFNPEEIQNRGYRDHLMRIYEGIIYSQKSLKKCIPNDDFVNIKINLPYDEGLFLLKKQ